MREDAAVARFEEHEIDRKREKLGVHRKGATRAFGSSHSEVPEAYYRTVGHPVLVPGSMGTASYVVVGADKALELTCGSTCHGAGRTMSPDLLKELVGRGIVIQAGSMKGLSEEAPIAYKDVSQVVKIVHGLGVARRAASLEPLVVIKG